MAKAVKIEVVKRDIIKPSMSTPEHKGHVVLSILDQMNFALSTPIVLFYSCENSSHTIPEKSQRLKSSMSKTLSLFYPVAGTIRDNSLIECNDNGIEYIEAQVGCHLSELFRRPDINALEELIPIELNPTEALTGARVQVNFFACGGLAIGVSLSPRIGDATALLTFILVWAKASRGNSSPMDISPELIPHFVGDSIIPSLNDSLGISSPLPPPPPPPPTSPIDSKRRTIRLVFDASKISLLNAQGTSSSVPRPSRVELVTALIWKCLTSISRSNFKGVKRNSVVSHAVNYRKRFVPPLPQNYIGNLSGRYLAEATEDRLDLPDLVARLRQGLEQTVQLITEGVQTNNILSPLLEYTKNYLDLHGSEDVDFYNFRSLCGFSLYEVDFGWGRPDWVIVTNSILKNYVIMVDTKDGEGVEAWVSLSQGEADLLERDQELLVFAEVNPSVNDDHRGNPLQCRI